MRLVDADALVARWKAAMLHMGRLYGNHPVALEAIIKDVEISPTIEAKPVIHGRWIEKVGRAKCSACGDECWADSAMEYHYCPNCGAKMDKEA